MIQVKLIYEKVALKAAFFDYSTLIDFYPGNNCFISLKIISRESAPVGISRQNTTDLVI